MSDNRQSSPGGAPLRKTLKTEAGSLNIQQVGEESEQVLLQGQVGIDPYKSENTMMKANKVSLKMDRDCAKADGLVLENHLLQDHVISAPKTERTCMGFEGGDQAMAKEPQSDFDDSILDQTIIAPEIMSIILWKLDLRSLKQVRLACKSWLLQAQYHFLRRGIVRLNKGTFSSLCSAGISKFAALCQKRIGTLPLPFPFVDVDLEAVSAPPPPVIILARLTLLTPPLAVTRFSQGASSSLHLAIPFIIQCSSTLEYLQLSAKSSTSEPVSLARIDSLQQLKFPKLRHLSVDASVHKETHPKYWTQVPSIVACISRNSPSLETYESECENCFYDNAKELMSQLSLQVDIKNVKDLTLSDYYINTVAFNHFLSIPFAQLQCLKLSVQAEGSLAGSREAVLSATVMKCANSLTTLDLSSFDGNIADLKLPLCPNIRELSLDTLRHSDDILLYRFPALQVLNVHRVGIDLERRDWNHWNSFSPLFDLKTLRIRKLSQFYTRYERIENQRSLEDSGTGGFLNDNRRRPRRRNLSSMAIIFGSNGPSPQLITFLKAFKGLERLCLPSSALISFCNDSWFETCCPGLPDGIRHLELCGQNYDYSSLAILKGVETITMMEFNDSVPVGDLPCLKLLQFPWGDYADMNKPKLMEITSRVERVAVTNCCSFSSKTGDVGSKELLETFFELVSYAECGCKDGNKIPNMMFERGR